MDFHQALADLTRNPLFTSWHKDHADYFLAHGFLMLDEANKNAWQFGFYSPDNEDMITFIIQDGKVTQTEGQEVLKSEGNIAPLKPEHIELSPDDALAKAKECFAEHYGQEQPIKQFFIVQFAEDHTLYNITYFTQSFTTINIKIDAKTGEVIKHSKQQLAAFA